MEHFPIEAGHILLFARSIGDPNPVYAGAEKAGSEDVRVIAPPTFAQASAQFDPEYFLRPQLGKRWFGSGTDASGSNTKRAPEAGEGRAGGGGAGSVGAGLHAEQHFEYHRHLVPGDVLSATTRPGERWEKQGRSGKLVFSETVTEYRDATGELVITARSVGVQTERPPVQGRA
ncbi:MAG TPA: MaoC family dehydratase N-terminal domain-containing protein [Acidimicrobiia bacterium]